jgi:hypothetical protein
LKHTLLSAMSNIDPGRLLDTRFLDLEGNDDESGFLPEAEKLVRVKLA